MPPIGEMFNNMETVAETACKHLQANPDFKTAKEFNILGLSQGGLIGRYIIERCEMPGVVRNFVSLGTPHMGIASVPKC